MGTGLHRPPFGQKGVALSEPSIARTASRVKWKPAASPEDTRNGDWFALPRVLKDLPLSCRLLFGAFVALADSHGELQASLRDLANYAGLSVTQVWRAARRLQAVRLLELVELGKGTQATTWKLRWRTFPQPSVSSYARVTLKPQRFDVSFAKAKTPASTKATPQLRRHRWVPSERAVRWALARARDRLWGLPRHRRERALAALARAFRWAARQPDPWTRERWRRFVLNTIAKFEDGPDGFTQARRRPYGWAMLCAREALSELTHRDADFKATQELVARIRREREEARRAWSGSRGFAWREVVTNVPREEGWWGIVLARTVLAGEQTY